MPNDCDTDQNARWYCLRSQPGRQNVAAAHLRSFGVEVFNPRLNLRKATHRGVIERSEPLFPNYLLARFDLSLLHRRVQYAFGVSDLVRFGGHAVEVPTPEVEMLRKEWGPGESLSLARELEPGMQVRLSGRLFYGMEAAVLCLLPARQRVKVLLDFLGGPKEAEIAAADLVPILAHPFAAV